MRPGQHNNNKRMRGRNRNNGGGGGGGNNSGGGGKGTNPLNRSFESNGPDVKIRGNPQQIAEKYMQLARDAQSSGDPVMAENYHQHAEHYYRVIAAAQAQFAPHQQPILRPDERDDEDDDGTGDDGGDDQQMMGVDGAQPGVPQQMPQGQPYRQDRFDRQGSDRQDRPERQDRPDRQDRPERPWRDDRRDRRFDQPRNQNYPQQGGEQPRPEFGDQPNAEFPQRRDRPYGDRPQGDDRGPRPNRFERNDRFEPRGERRERFNRGPDNNGYEPRPLEGAPPEVMPDPVVMAPEPQVIEPPAMTGEESGLPSFVTRAAPRRRGRPPFRPREDAEGGEAAPTLPAAETPPRE